MLRKNIIIQQYKHQKTGNTESYVMTRLQTGIAHCQVRQSWHVLKVN